MDSSVVYILLYLSFWDSAEYWPGRSIDPKCIQFDAMDAHIGSANKRKGSGIPPKYHPGLLQGLCGICANSIRCGKKRNDMQTPAMEYRL